MTLRLSVVSEHGSRLGAASTKVFGVRGGTIGRGTDNAWILPDPERYLSGNHARIDFRAGNYVLVDTSSNGTFINGAQVPLGKFHDYQLKDGDYVRLGEYEILVSIDKTNDFAPGEDAMAQYDDAPLSLGATKSPPNVDANSDANSHDLGVDLDLSALLETNEFTPLKVGRRRDDYHQILANSETPGPASGGVTDATARDPATPWHMVTRPLKVNSKAGIEGSGEAAGPPGRSQTPTLFEGSEPDSGLVAFCRGAGLDPRAIDPETRVAALHLAGQLLRESVLGVMDLNQNRNEFRKRFRIPPPATGAQDTPLDFSRGVDEAMVRLLTTPSTRHGAVEAVRHNFRELKAQNEASVTAMRAALEEFLQRVDPKELEERFERSSKRGVFGTQSKSKYWDLYLEMFPVVAQRPADGFPHLFAETFAKTYEAKLNALVPPRRSTFGADRDDYAHDPPSRVVGHP